MFEKLANKTLLITGGTGSFGSTVVRHLIESDVKEIRIFSRDEKKQNDMRGLYQSKKLKFYLGDVRNYQSVEEALDHVNFIFHASALKQVPSCEFYPVEAVRTNVLGTDNVLRAAARTGVEKVVVLSTDKAAEPVNAMGMSKALMEKVMSARARQLNSENTVFCATRYGNVMASRGSVIPLMVSKIKEKSPLLITDPSMTRFLMPLQDAMSLVLYAFENAKQGDLFVQKSPAATIEDLAKALQELFESQLDTRIIGTRHGEKKHETLVTTLEMARSEELDNYYRISPDDRDLNYENYFEEGDQKISSCEAYTSENTKRLTISEIKEHLLKTDYIQEELKSHKTL